jgi:putative ABC transport system substrate-binding protein
MRCSAIGGIVTLILSLIMAPLSADAQAPTKVYRMGWLSASNAPPSGLAPTAEAFQQGLRDLGYVEGQNIAIAYRYAEGKPERLSELAAELVRLNIDVLVATGPEATLRAARHATSTIPIVMLAVNYDPIARGYIDGLARPGGNITGVFFMQLELTAKRLELLKVALPQVTRVSALWDAHTADQLRVAEAAAQALGLQLQSVELRHPPYDFVGAIGVAVRQQAQALVVLSSPHFAPQRAQIAALALKHRLPASFLFREYVEAGGLMSYGANQPAMYRHAATYVDKILKGAKPADLPVEQPIKFELVLNLKTAKALGLTMPPSLLLLADEVIQ